MNPYEELVGALCSAGFDESKFSRDKGKFASHPGGTSEKEIRSSDVKVGDYIGDNRVVRSEKKDATTHIIQTEGGPPEELPADAPVLVKREKDGPLPSSSLLDELRARRNNPGYKPGGKTTTDAGYKWRKISQAERKKSKLAASAGFDESKVTRDKGKFANQAGEKTAKETKPKATPKVKPKAKAKPKAKPKPKVDPAKQKALDEVDQKLAELQKKIKDPDLPGDQFSPLLEERGRLNAERVKIDTGFDIQAFQDSQAIDPDRAADDAGDPTMVIDDAAVARSNAASAATDNALDSESADLISQYTDDIASRELNEELQSGVSTGKLARSDVDRALQTAISTERDLGTEPPAVVYRGITHFDAADFEIGAEVEAPAYSSTSVRPDIASGFTDEASSPGERAVLEIVPLAGTGVHVATLSENPDEAEYVIGRGARFEVVGTRSEVFTNGPEQVPGTTKHQVIKLRQIR